MDLVSKFLQSLSVIVQCCGEVNHNREEASNGGQLLHSRASRSSAESEDLSRPPRGDGTASQLQQVNSALCEEAVYKLSPPPPPSFSERRCWRHIDSLLSCSILTRIKHRVVKRLSRHWPKQRTPFSVTDNPPTDTLKLEHLYNYFQNKQQHHDCTAQYRFSTSCPAY